VAVAIVERALFWVRQNLIGLRRVFEARLGLLVAEIAVWMQFEGQLAVGPLQLGRIRLPGYAEHLVVVWFFTHGMTA
jgi:hypothetical protein